MTTVSKIANEERNFPVNLGERNIGRWQCRLVKHSDFAAADDIVQLITIPENTLIGRIYIITKEVFNGTTPKINVGDGTTVNGYVEDADYDATSLTEAAAQPNADTGAAYYATSARPFYTSADTLDVEFGYSGSPTTGECIVCAELITVPGV